MTTSAQKEEYVKKAILNILFAMREMTIPQEQMFCMLKVKQ
ncbi:hypothetical protein [Metasolibacillus sp. FSL K6-0083]